MGLDTDGFGSIIAGSARISAPLVPRGAGADDWAPLFGPEGSAVQAAARGATAQLASGTWLVKSNQSIPDQLSLECEPLTSIVSSIPPAGSFPGNYPFHLDAPSSVQAGTLAATPQVGATTLSVALATKPAVGHYLQLIHGVSSSFYKVMSSPSVSSPWTVTIDRPTCLPWTSANGGDEVVEYASRPSDVCLKFKGKQSGTGDQFVQIVRTDGVYLSGFNLTPDAGLPNAGLGLDLGCTQCLFEDCAIDLTGGVFPIGSIGAFAQSNEFTTFRRIRVRNPSSEGLALYDCVGCRIEDAFIEGGAGVGVSLSTLGNSGTDGKTSLGCYDCTVSGGCAVGTSIGAAAAFAGVCTNSAIENFAAIGCTSFGLYVGSAAVATRLINDDVRNSRVGVLVQAGATDTKVVALRADNCTLVAFSCSSDLDLTGMTSTCNYASNGLINFGGTGTWRCRGLNLTQLNINGYLLYVTSAGRLELDGALLQGDVVGVVRAAVGIFINAAATVVLRNTKLNMVDQGIYVGASAILILDSSCDLSGANSPFTGPGNNIFADFTGAATIAMTGADHTAAWAEYAVRDIVTTGTLGSPRNCIMPAIRTAWVFKNSSDQTVTFKCSTGTGIAVTAGSTARGRFDGTNIVAA